MLTEPAENDDDVSITETASQVQTWVSQRPFCETILPMKLEETLVIFSPLFGDV